MPPIYINGHEVVKRYVGIQEVVSAYVGSQQVFSSSNTEEDVIAMFGATDQGFMLDFTDLATVYQDSSLTAPVTSYDDAIGGVVDKSGKGNNALQSTSGSRPRNLGMPLSVGSEIASNCGFDSDTVWVKGAGWSIGSGVATKSAGAATNISQSVALTAGKRYMLVYTMTRSAGSLTPKFSGGTDSLGRARVASGGYVDLILAVSGNTTLEFVADAAFSGTLDNVTIKEVTAWANPGAYFEGAQYLETATVNLSGSSKATVAVACVVKAKAGQNCTLVDLAGQYLGGAGRFEVRYQSAQKYAFLRGASGQAIVNETYPIAPSGEGTSYTAVEIVELDTTAASELENINLGRNSQAQAESRSGAIAGSNALASGTITLGALKSGAGFWLNGYIYKAVVINRLLTSGEKATLDAWLRQSKIVYGAVLGDSTDNEYSNHPRTSSLIPGFAATDIAYDGDRIANQKTKWNAIADKSSFQCAFIRIGLNDVQGRVGGNTATASEVIADLQDLVDTVNSTKPTGCKVYIGALTPCKAWLDAATNPSAAYAAWQSVNEAIAGNGANPITGVDARFGSYVSTLNDGSDGLLEKFKYSPSDNVHPSAEARFIIAQEYRAQLVADSLL